MAVLHGHHQKSKNGHLAPPYNYSFICNKKYCLIILMSEESIHYYCYLCTSLLKNQFQKNYNYNQ